MSTKVLSECKSAKNIGVKSAKNADNQYVYKQFSFLKRTRNDQYEASLIPLPLRSCLLLHKSDYLLVRTQPKWFTDLMCENYDTNSGELLSYEVHQTNDFKRSNNGKIKALNKFCNHFQPLYRKRQVSLLFYTLTTANQSASTISGIIDVLKMRLKRKKQPLLGYIWTSEVSENLHWHYHLCIAVNRLDIVGKSLPDHLKLDSVWEAICQVEFVKKNVKYYLSKYFAKHNYRINGIRSYGISKIKK
jgi:hypothetical protein